MPHQFSLLLLVGMLPFRPNQSVRNILKYCVVEEKRLLLYKSNLGSPPLEVDLMQGDAATLHIAISEVLYLQVFSLGVQIDQIAILNLQVCCHLQHRQARTISQSG